LYLYYTTPFRICQGFFQKKLKNFLTIFSIAPIKKIDGGGSRQRTRVCRIAGEGAGQRTRVCRAQKV
jgi:hypothetical protein